MGKKEPQHVYVIRRIVALALLAYLLVAIIGAIHWLQNDDYRCDKITPDVVVEMDGTHVVTVHSGDTLYAIGERHCVGNLSLVMDDLVLRYGNTIYPGQRIVLP